MSCYNSTVPSLSPREVMVESQNPASLMVSWRPPAHRGRNGPIVGYTINYAENGSSDVMSINVNGTKERTVTISELTPYVNYAVIVAAMTVNGTGPFINSSVVGRSGEDCELNSLHCHLYMYVLLYHKCKLGIIAVVHTRIRA